MESKPSTSQLLQQKVFICEELATLISSSGKVKFATTLDEVYDLLKDYICAKKLYDPFMPDRIRCENDDLGSILGVNEFRIGEVRGFLQKLVYPVKKVSATTCKYHMKLNSTWRNELSFQKFVIKNENELCLTEL